MICAIPEDCGPIAATTSFSINCKATSSKKLMKLVHFFFISKIINYSVRTAIPVQYRNEKR
jgi:hypothetical protein